MTTTTQPDFVYHVLLIGIDAYAGAALGGCVNDIDDIEALLLNQGLLGPNADTRIKRLAAPGPGASTSHSQSNPPTRNNILNALKALADPQTVSSNDRVLVYYSGHGAQKMWDRGFAGSPWLKMAFLYWGHFVMRWPSRYMLVDEEGNKGNKRKAWQIVRGKKTWSYRRGATGGCGTPISAALEEWVCWPWRHATQTIRTGLCGWWYLAQLRVEHPGTC